MAVSLGDIDPSSTPDAPGDKNETIEATEALKPKLADLQYRLYAEHKQGLLVVLQAMDTGGKDGAIRGVFSGVNPQGMRVRSFKEPSDEELDHDFLWRVHPHVPARGEIAVFNRSHYEAVLVERVLKLAPEKVWRKRYETIRAFEQSLVDSGTRILKFMLHISKEEQAERYAARLDDPTKRWKYSEGDLKMTAKWSHFMDAYEDAINETSTKDAPWIVVPADRKWYRNWVVMRAVVDALEAMDPQFPT